MRLIGAIKFRKTEKEATNSAYWRPKIQKKQKKRSPMRLIGALKFMKIEKEVTNEAYWRHKIQENRKRGHQ
jgi:hypothetical protein